MTFPHSILTDGEKSSLTVFIDGEAYTTDNSHPRWSNIVDLVKQGNYSVVDLFDLRATAAKSFEQVTDRVSYCGGELFFDGDPIRSELSHVIVGLIEGGAKDFMPLVKFMEKLAGNPSDNSRDQLYNFIAKHDMTITEDGNLLAYKGVRFNRDSVHAGYAIVDGVEHNGHIPNNDGSVISMPRSRVEDNRDVACSHGLHAGTYAYAKDFGELVLAVEIDPVHVVSVPSDSNDQKIRCCKYKVLNVVEEKLSGPVYVVYDEDDEEDWSYDQESYYDRPSWTS